MPNESMQTGRSPGGPAAGRGARWGLMLVLLWVLTVGLWNGALEPGPDRRRFYDERYNFQNVSGVLLEEGHRPVNGYYPPLSYLPQTAALAVVHGAGRWLERPAWTIHDGRRFTPLAYRLARAFSALYAVLAVWLLYRLGRSLFDPVTGLVAACLLAIVPLHMHHSGFFKPDSLLVAACVLALLLALGAVRSPNWGAWARAGAGVGLATTAKLNGVSTAVPLVLASFLGWRPDRRSLARLAAAAGVALAVVAVTQPFPGLALRDLAHNLEIYEWKAQRQGAPEGGPWRQVVPLLLSVNYHGPFFGALALAGLVGFLIAALRSGTDRDLRRGLVVPLGFFFGYTILVGATTPFARFTLFLPVAPVTALAAAWVAVWAVRRAADLRPALGRAAAWALAGLLVVTGVLAHRHLYRWYVPTTWELAGQLASRGLESPSFRLVCYAEGDETPRVKRQGKRSAMRPLTGGEGSGGPTSQAALCDVSILPLRAGPEASDPRRAWYEAGSRRIRLDPAWGRARGPALELGLHPWRSGGPPIPVELEPGVAHPGQWLGEIPTGERAESMRSLALRIPAGLDIEGRPVLTVGGEVLDLYWMDVLRGDGWYLSARLPGRNLDGPVELRLGPSTAAPSPELLVLRWLPPARGEGLRTHR